MNCMIIINFDALATFFFKLLPLNLIEGFRVLPVGLCQYKDTIRTGKMQ